MSRQQDHDSDRKTAEEQVVLMFLAGASSIILESPTLDGVRFDAVVALADEVGLSRQQLARELRLLRLRGVITSFPDDQLDTAGAVPPLPAAPAFEPPPEMQEATSADDIPPQASAPPVADAAHKREPASGSPAVPEPPAEAFCRWVQQKLAGYPSLVLAEDDEHGLIGVGTYRYHLAEVLAGHIVRDVATARNMRLERDLAGASCHSTVSESAPEDARWSDFFQQVAPILARHRGMNAQSRVLINAVAQELGLSDEELARALTLLPQSAPGSEELDSRQLERRESYRSYLRRTMAQLPDGIVTFQTHRRLMEAGEHFHGVAPQWIRPTIHEVASEMGVRFVSQEQAMQHVMALIQDAAADDLSLDAAARARVYAAGTRWGLDPIDVDGMLRRHAEQVRQQIAADRLTTRWILAAATAAFLGGFVLLVWLIVPRPRVAAPVLPVSASAVSELPAAGPAQLEDVAWWGDELRIATAQTRTAHPELRTRLDQARRADAAARGEAYRELAAWYVREARPSPPKVLETLFALWFAREPDAAAAELVPATLLAPSVALDHGLPPDARGIAAAFRGVRAAARMANQPSLPDARRAKLASLLESALHTPPDQVLAADVVPEAVAGLARRCYTALVERAADEPERVGRFYRALSAEASASLDDATLHRLDAELLAILLPELDTRWAAFRDALQRTTRSNDPAVVLKLLDLFREATDPLLRSYLAAVFAERLGVAPDALTEPELVAALRKTLGVTAREQLAQRWQGVAEQAETLLARDVTKGSDPAGLLQETVDLARLSACACALAHGDAGSAVFAELEAAGPRRLDIVKTPAVAPPTEPFVTPYPLPPAIVLRHYIDKLGSSRSASDRSALLRMMAAAAESVADLDPVAGQTLAAYLWRAVPLEEHQERLALLPKFARWNALRLGVADQLAAGEAPRESGAREVVRVVCGREVDLHDQADRQAARRQLLALVLSDLAETADVADTSAQAFDAAHRALVDFYQVQARLLQVPASSYAAADDVATVLTALITHVAGRLDESALTPPERQFVAALPQQLTAVAFVAESDLHQAVLLQQIWLRVLSAHLARPLAAKTLALREIVKETQPAAQAGARVDTQLHTLEAGLLRLWLLYRPDPAPAAAVAQLR